ncbi:CLUMA_CG004154, isoform A [Clunio marinus]|uniref:CLUMA_CG004154, isoform A n=1 Tax=Clunio marinus TaxID=568069 RepID=A0A1J1HVD1_9DIPT|nr:CLUMA_CG004154, isoform A [Clunio marinus]
MKNVKFDRDDRFIVSLGSTISDDDSDNHTDPQFHQSKSNHFVSGMLNQDHKLLTNVVERAADDILKALMDVSPPEGFDNLSGNSRIQQNFNPSPQQMIADTSTPELFSDSFGQSNDGAQNLSFSHRVNSARQTTTPFKDSMEEYLYHEGLNNNATAAVSRPAQSPHNLSLNTRIKMAHQNFLENCPDRATPPNSPAAQLSHDRSFNTRPQRTPLKFTANDDLLENTSMPSGFEEYLESPNASTLNNRHQRARKALLNEIEDTVQRLADNLKLVDDVKSPPLFNKITTQNQRDQLSPYYKSPPGQATSPKFLQFSPVQPLMEFSPHHLTPFSPYHAVETSPKNLRPASPRVSPYQGAQTNSNINTRRQRTPLKFSPNDDNLLEDTSMPSGFDEYLESPNATKNLRPPSPRVSPYQGAQATPKSPRPVSPRVRYSPRAVPSSNIRRSLNNSRSPPKNVERRRNDNNDQGGNLDNIAQIQEPIDLPLDQAEDEPQLMSEFQNWLDQGVVPVPWGRTEEPLHPFDDHEREFLIRGLVINGVNQLRAAQMILDGQYDYMN